MGTLLCKKRKDELQVLNWNPTLGIPNMDERDI